MIKRLIISTGILLLASCASNPPQQLSTETIPQYQSQLSDLSEINYWYIKGRISVQTTEDAFSASFTWRREESYQRLEITGMLGQQYALLEIFPDYATLTVQDSAPVQARNVDALMWSQLGFTIPVALLTDWIKAYPTSSTQPSIRINESGMIRAMSFQNWQVTYRKYVDYPDYENMQLPARLTVTNERETIKLAIKTWQAL